MIPGIRILRVVLTNGPRGASIIVLSFFQIKRCLEGDVTMEYRPLIKRGGWCE